jgi:hypothetical protein
VRGSTGTWQRVDWYVITKVLELQRNKKVFVHLLITIQKVTSNVQMSPDSLQTFIGTPTVFLKTVFSTARHLLSLILTTLS